MCCHLISVCIITQARIRNIFLTCYFFSYLLLSLHLPLFQAGGAPSQVALAAAVRSIEEALKNSDWTTRKTASVALAGIAMSGGSLLQSIKASCVTSLESCRFDKVSKD